jgi:hypothetical protein
VVRDVAIVDSLVFRREMFLPDYTNNSFYQFGYARMAPRSFRRRWGLEAGTKDMNTLQVILLAIALAVGPALLLGVVMGYIMIWLF